MPLDLGKLQNVKPAGPDCFQAACPQCRIDGSDRAGVHLRVWKTGEYSCVIAPNDRDHNRAIHALAGDGTDSTATDLAPPPEPRIEIERTWPPTALSGLIRDHSYWAGRGIPEDVLEPLQGGVATKGQLANRYVIPIFGDDGLIHGFTGRALRPGMLPKYKHIGKVSNWVWGDLAGIEETGRAILIEGPADRLALDARGVRGALVLWGVNLSQAVLGYLISVNVRDIVVATNNDTKAHAAGQRAAAKILATLERFFDAGTARTCLPGPKDLLDQHWRDGAPDDDAWAEWMARLDPAPPEVAHESPDDSSPTDDLDT
jgi:hypothetical protein